MCSQLRTYHLVLLGPATNTCNNHLKVNLSELGSLLAATSEFRHCCKALSIAPVVITLSQMTAVDIATEILNWIPVSTPDTFAFEHNHRFQN